MNKPKLSFWQIWNMSFGFLGIQFGLGLQNANVSRIFQTLGAEVDELAIFWLAAPVTGLLVQPIIGYLSDKTWTRLGRRRPYFLIGALLASAALFIMPHSSSLWMAAGMLWILDASINISMEPFRAFVGDMLPEEQRNKGFAMQSFFIGTGAVVASALPWMMANWFGISNDSVAGAQPNTVTYSFYIGGVVFLIAVLWTVFSSKEYSPEQLKSFEDNDGQNASGGNAHETVYTKNVKFMRNGTLWLLAGSLATFLIHHFDMDKKIFVLTACVAFFGLLQMLTAIFVQKNKTNGLVEIIQDLFHMPKTMGQLSFVQFFTWFALFAMWIYSTPAVTSHIFGATDVNSEAYKEGADWVGVLMAVYNGFAALFAFLLPVLAKKTSRKITHMIALIIGGLSLISFLFIKNHYVLIISEIGIGLAWASILSMPYAILTGSLPRHKMGIYMGIFNFFIVIPQILAASILGALISTWFGNDSIWALVIGGISMIIAGVLTLFVTDKKG